MSGEGGGERRKEGQLQSMFNVASFWKTVCVACVEEVREVSSVEVLYVNAPRSCFDNAIVRRRDCESASRKRELRTCGAVRDGKVNVFSTFPTWGARRLRLIHSF